MEEDTLGVVMGAFGGEGELVAGEILTGEEGGDVVRGAFDHCAVDWRGEGVRRLV